MSKKRWWKECEGEDDIAFYRRHIVKSASTIDWMRDTCGLAAYGEESSDRDWNVECLDFLMSHIDERDAEIIRMRHGEGLKWKDISKALGYNLSYLWKRERRAMARLREVIAEHDLKPWRDYEKGID